MKDMRTDSKGLMDAGLALSIDLWTESAAEWGWGSDTGGVDRYIIHQVSVVHTREICRALDIDPERVPLTFPTRGNMGPASIPFTLAGELGSLSGGDRLLLMGIGSGLNASCVEIVW